MESPHAPSTSRPRLDARTTAWLIAQRERVHALELEQARLSGELSASERIERAAQRYADKLEEKLSEARKRALSEQDTTLLVEAGAGTGKTALIAGRVVRLCAQKQETAQERARPISL